MQIKKMDRQAVTTGAEESKKSEPASKPKTSKGIGESESKFETSRSSSLFSSSRSSTPPKTNITDGTSNTIVVAEQSTPLPKTPRTEDGSHQQSRTTTITDGSSNTIIVGEQSPESSAPQASTPESSTDPVVVIGSGNNNVTSAGGNTESTPEFSTQDQQTPVTTKEGSQVGSGGESQQASTVTINDGSSNTIVPEGESTASTEQQTNITDGTSNTIIFGEESTQTPPEFPTQDQQTPVTTKDGSQIGSGSESQQAGTVTINDGSSNTIVPEGESTEPTEQQINITDGTSNTIIVGE